jgi:hypothetical protein
MTMASLWLVDFNLKSCSVNVMGTLVRSMCGSRTGGWSLPGVMSD